MTKSASFVESDQIERFSSQGSSRSIRGGEVVGSPVRSLSIYPSVTIAHARASITDRGIG